MTLSEILTKLTSPEQRDALAEAYWKQAAKDYQGWKNTPCSFKSGYSARDKQVDMLIKMLTKAVDGLKFECGDRCAEQNPCNSKDVLRELEQIAEELG